MAGGALIRELREQDAAAVARLDVEINPHQVLTPEMVWQRASCPIEREQRREWLAEIGGEVAGHALAGFEWSLPTPGKGWFWIGVLPGRRYRGIGDELYGQVEEYLRTRGAWRLRSWVDDDPAGARFLERRGFEPHRADRISELDLRVAELPDVYAPEGFRVSPLGEARDRVEDLFQICAAGELDMPGEEAETELDLESWKLDDFGVPTLSDEGSFVALAGERPVSLAFLTVDQDRRLGYNLMTATLPNFRRRGLGLALKVAVGRWAAANGIERLLTENDVDNVGMLAINDRLGYRPLYDQASWVLEGKRPARKGG